MPWMTALWNWTSDNDDARGSFRNRPLYRIALPGTHDSGCYVDQTLTNALSKTQLQDIYAQLEGGIRYFDIRPSVKNGHFYTYHGAFYTGGQLDGDVGILAQVRQFLEERKPSERELVILNISHFYKFTNQNHVALIAKINEILGEFLVPYTQAQINLFSTPYKDLLTDGKNTHSRVAILYDGALDTPRESYIEGRDSFPKGFFVVAPKYVRADNNIFLFDQYANSIGVDDGYKYDGMQTDQYKKLTRRDQYAFAPNGNWIVPPGYESYWFNDRPDGVENTMHLLSWTLTPQKVGGEPIKYATEYANPRLLRFFADGGRWKNGASYDSLKDPQINIVYVDAYASIRHEIVQSPWYGLAMPVAIAAQINYGPVGQAGTW